MNFIYFATAIRLSVPLLIFQWPVEGVILSFISDAFDWEIMKASKLNFYGFYQAWDKSLDLYFMSILLILSLRWNNNLAKKTSIVLFSYRLLGVFLFEFTGIRPLLFIFPNIFEFFVMAYVLQLKILGLDLITSTRQVFLFLLILTIPKFIQEYVLHVGQVDFWKIFKWKY